MSQKIDFASHIIKRGETIRTISSLYKVQSWQEIANSNNLDYPFIVDNLQGYDNRNVKTVGDTLLIPLNSDSVVINVSTSELERLTYGVDLSVVTDMNLESGLELKSDLYGDLEVAVGVDNLRQAILLRLMTPKGDLVLHPDWGSDLPDMLGVKGVESNKVKLALEVESTIRSEYRVKDVRNIKVTLENRALTVECDIIPISPLEPFKFYEIIE